MTIDLDTLPPPEMIEEISFETIISELMTDVIARFTAAGIAYDVGNLEVDPVKIVLEAAAARETKLRARFNSGLKSNLAAYAKSGDLRHLGAFHGLAELPGGEEDAAFLTRMLLTIFGRSAAGPEERYEALAMEVSANIRQAKAYRSSTGPELNIAILTYDNGGVPTQTLLDDVKTHVDQKDKKVINDVVTTVAAVSQTVDVTADVWLLPETPQAVFDGLHAVLSAAWANEVNIGFDVNTSWLHSKLHVAGVSRVEMILPASSVTVGDNEAATLGTVTLNYRGRAR